MHYAFKQDERSVKSYNTTRKERKMDNQEKLVSQLAQEVNEDSSIIDEEKLESVTGAGLIDAVKNCFGCGSSDAAETHLAPNESPATRQDRWTAYFHEVNSSPMSRIDGTVTPLRRTPNGHLERTTGGNVVTTQGRVIVSPQVAPSSRQRWT
jgi:hypothetical protein